jgi:lysophospholipase L1-like esterase
MLPARNAVQNPRPLPLRSRQLEQVADHDLIPSAVQPAVARQRMLPARNAVQNRRPLPPRCRQLVAVRDSELELEREPEPEPEPMYPSRRVLAFLERPQRAMVALAHPQWLVLGDSYTVGHGVTESEGWPAQLAAQLEDPPQIITIARSGWTIADLASAMDDRMTPALLGRMSVVSLMIGVNDQIQSRDGDSPETIFREAFAALLSRAVSLAIDTEPTRVVVLSIPYWTATPKGLERSIKMDDGGHSAEVTEQQIARHNAVLQQTAVEAGVHFVDAVTSISQQCLVRPELTGDDGLHPSALQYTEWATAVLPAVQSALGV